MQFHPATNNCLKKKTKQNHIDIKLDNYIVFWVYNAHTAEYLVTVLNNVLQ